MGEDRKRGRTGIASSRRSQTRSGRQKADSPSSSMKCGDMNLQPDQQQGGRMNQSEHARNTTDHIGMLIGARSQRPEASEPPWRKTQMGGRRPRRRRGGVPAAVAERRLGDSAMPASEAEQALYRLDGGSRSMVGRWASR